MYFTFITLKMRNLFANDLVLNFFVCVIDIFLLYKLSSKLRRNMIELENL